MESDNAWRVGVRKLTPTYGTTDQLIEEKQGWKNND